MEMDGFPAGKLTDLLKMIFYFPNGKVTTWGIYRKMCFIFEESLKQIQATVD